MQNSTALNFIDRQKCFADLEKGMFDILVIGAGITGCGIARDAAMRGLKVALVEAGDIASGTSSRSSKLIHGGLRYLSQGQVGIVREAANERRTLRRIAPHLSLTNPMVILGKSKNAIRTYRTGLWTYEKLGKVDRHERHELWDMERLCREEPAVDATDLEGAVVYPEYLTDDSRLTLANARSAAGHGAVLVTRARVEEILLEGNRAVGAVVKGMLPSEQRQATVGARLVVNAAGPWVDVIRRMEKKDAKSRLQLTKGIHLVFARDRLPINRSVVWSAADKRGLFAVPRGQFVYIGTTDTFYAKPEYHPKIMRADIDYLLDSVNATFKLQPLSAGDVVSAWSGLRPLLSANGKQPSEISRRDEVITGSYGIMTIAGGKLTSFRAMAARMVDLCEKKLGRKPAKQCLTANEALPGGGFDLPFTVLTSRIENLGLPRDEARRAAMLYGGEALELFARGHGPAVEAGYAVEREGALTLEDYWVRRSSRAYFDAHGGMDCLEPAADAMAGLLGWSEVEKDNQVESCRRQRREDMAMFKN